MDGKTNIGKKAQSEKSVKRRILSGLSVKKLVFYPLFLCTFLWLVYASLRTHGAAFDRLFFYDENDSFMDFFYFIFATNDKNFAYVAPPNANLIFYLFQAFFPREFFLGDQYALRDTRLGLMIVIIYLLVNFFAIAITMFFYRGWKDYKEATLFTFIILFSRPFLFTYERGHIILLCFLLTLFFFLYRNNKRPIIREIMLIFLAIAASIKIYPAIYGLLLIKEKKYREAVRLVFYGLFFFFVPAFFFNGVDTLKTFFPEFFAFYSNISTILTGNVNNFHPLSLSNYIYMLGGQFNFLLRHISLIRIFFIILATIAFFLEKKSWKSALYLTFLTVCVPSISAIYVLIFAAIPLLMFMTNDDEKTPENPFSQIFYAIFFVLLFAPLPLPEFRKGFMIDYVECISFYTVTIFSAVWTMINYGVKRYSKKEKLIAVNME